MESYSLQGKSTHPQSPSLTCGLGRWDAFMDTGRFKLDSDDRAPLGDLDQTWEEDTQGKGAIYQLLFPSGKSYVGQTRRWDKRMREHKRCKGYADGHIVKRAIKKYGWSSVKVIMLEQVPTDRLNEAERSWIAIKGTLCPGGYNLTEGGDAQPMDNPLVRKWQKKRIGDAMRSEKGRATKRRLWKDEAFRKIQRERRAASAKWAQARRDCQNSEGVNEKRRHTWAAKRAAKVVGMDTEEGRKFMERAMKHAVRLARKAAKRIDPDYGRDPVKETVEFWGKEIKFYEETVWRRHLQAS